mgnify:FL=1|jgi:GR25 family glycosyltransferase involved in LPS biosynthesis|tara:strand:+ start:4659 stop:5312 length:654 start_codon:yes stop_codon:yes gene_type:complete
MKHFVITILDNNKSVEAADRCISSAARYGLEVEKFQAITPGKNLTLLLKDNQINTRGFDNNQYSREDNCKAAFMSHYSLWQKCVQLNTDITIFEHDAVVVDYISNISYNSFINLGKPSYGKYNIPSMLGVNPLVSKKYMPGAHAYRLKPKAAKALIAAAREAAGPTDVFLHVDRFPFLEEYYPWPVECRDSFTTIQSVNGCLAKHGYNDNYVIEDIQ